MKQEPDLEDEQTSDFENFDWTDIPSDDMGDDSPEYASEDKRYQHDLITSDSAKALIERITNTTLSRRLKVALLGNIRTYFTRDAYLAYISNPDRVMLNIQYDVELGMLSATAHDKRKHELTQIKSLVLDSYPFIVSRSIGGMERDLQGKTRIEQRTGTARVYEDAAEKRRRRFRE